LNDNRPALPLRNCRLHFQLPLSLAYPTPTSPIPLRKHGQSPLVMARCSFSWKMMFRHPRLSPLQMIFLRSTACGMTQALFGTITPAWSSKGFRSLSFTGRRSIHQKLESLGNLISGKELRASGLNGRYGIMSSLQPGFI
jgi:hypothetical protein